MLNFRAIYREAEEHTGWYLALCVFILACFIVAQSIFSPLFVVAMVFTTAFLILTIQRPLWTLACLAVYLPFEPVILKFVPDDIYVFARYFSEGLIYVVAGVVAWNVLMHRLKTRATVLDLPFVLFVVVVCSSAIINLVNPTVAVLGLRQILRFIIVFFLIVYLRPSRRYVQTLTWVLFGVVAFESMLGFLQPLLGESLDQWLLPSESRAFGDITLTSGVSEFWDPGTRIFGTLGRYDRLGNFLYFFLLLGVGFAYEWMRTKDGEGMRKWLFWLFALGLPALLLTYSRASWFAFLLGFLFIGILIKRDRRVAVGFASLIIVAVGYIGISGLHVRFITEAPGQTLVERFYESFSYARWVGEYYGLGRVFWFVQTPLTVIPAAPIFGFGPGQYGGGAVAALGNTRVYEQLGLPFGVFGTEGSIDNNWFSLWGETGTLGFVLYLWMFAALFFFALRVYRSSSDPYVRSLAVGFAAIVLAVSFNAFTATVLEIRTLAFYFWMYAGFLAVLAQEKRPPSV